MPDEQWQLKNPVENCGGCTADLGNIDGDL
jgi:hypothetical protein